MGSDRRSHHLFRWTGGIPWGPEGRRHQGHGAGLGLSVGAFLTTGGHGATDLRTAVRGRWLAGTIGDGRRAPRPPRRARQSAPGGRDQRRARLGQPRGLRAAASDPQWKRCRVQAGAEVCRRHCRSDSLWKPQRAGREPERSCARALRRPPVQRTACSPRTMRGVSSGLAGRDARPGRGPA